MMNRIQQKFKSLQQQQRKAISPYITAGDPSADITVPLLHALVDAGADILELGIPFSDPMAEGPVIQAAMERALDNHINLAQVLKMAAEFREQDNTTPLILMGYLNPIEAMGYAEFASAAHKAGVDGLIIVDLPPEEATAIQTHFSDQHIDLIFLFSPTTTAERLALICQQASGYLYYVSLKGVTGAGHIDTSSIDEMVTKARSLSKLPIVVGFGIKTPENAAAIADTADGIVVGSALIATIAELLPTPQEICAKAPLLIKAMRAAIDA